jgi:hypothetical protein
MKHVLWWVFWIASEIIYLISFTPCKVINLSWAYGKEKIRGGGKKFALLFRIVPKLSKKIFRIEKLSRNWGGGGRSDYEKFLLDSIFPTILTELPTKLTEFVPFIFIINQYCPTVKRILPDCEANIARLALFVQQTGGLPPPSPGTPMQSMHSLDSGFLSLVPDSAPWILDSTTWIPDSRSVVDSGFQKIGPWGLKDSGLLQCLDSGFRIAKLLKVGFWITLHAWVSWLSSSAW